MMAAPSRWASRVNSGCSARQGVHQLAKKFTIVGLPVRSSASVSGLSPSRSARRSSRGAGRPTITEPIDAGSRPAISDQAKKPAISARVSERQEEEETAAHSGAPVTRPGHVRRVGAPMRRRRSESETKPPKAQSAAPSQIQGASGLR